MKPYGLPPRGWPFHPLDCEPDKFSRSREKRHALQMLALDVDDACPCGCDDAWVSRGGAFASADCSCEDCDPPVGYHEPMRVSLGEVAA